MFSPEFLVHTAVYLGTGLVFIAVNAYKIGQLESKLATKQELIEKVKERNQVVDRVYERFDEFKKTSNDQFVRKDMCGQLHISTKDEMKRIDEEYKTFRHEIRNTVQMIMDKIDQLKELVQDKRG